jgi:hypothetical protein
LSRTILTLSSGLFLCNIRVLSIRCKPLPVVVFLHLPRLAWSERVVGGLRKYTTRRGLVQQVVGVSSWLLRLLVESVHTEIKIVTVNRHVVPINYCLSLRSSPATDFQIHAFLTCRSKRNSLPTSSSQYECKKEKCRGND